MRAWLTAPAFVPRATALALLVAATGCDSSYGGFLDAVPVSDVQAGSDEPAHVYLAIDGMSRAAFDGARARGAFAWLQASDLIGFFPAVSDYSWTRLLRTGSMHGHELQYYDAESNRMSNLGVRGVVEHPLREGLLDPLPVYRDFDFLGDGVFWMAAGYADPEAALPTTLDAMFALLATRARRQNVLTAYLMNVDVASHRHGFDSAVAMLVEIDRRLLAFRARHPGRFRFTLFADHGNAHRRAALIDPRDILKDSGIRPVESFDGDPDLQAIPIVHVRVSFASVHTRPGQASRVAELASRHRWVDVAVARDDADPAGVGQAFVLWRAGRAYRFARTAGGGFRVREPAAWNDLGVDLSAHTVAGAAEVDITDRESLAATAQGPYPDVFFRVASAFLHPAVRHPAEVILSMPDDVTSFGFHLPGSGDSQAVHGFHGSLTRGSALTVVATETHVLPPVVRADELLDWLPPLAERMRAAATPSP